MYTLLQYTDICKPEFYDYLEQTTVKLFYTSTNINLILVMQNFILKTRVNQ